MSERQTKAGNQEFQSSNVIENLQNKMDSFPSPRALLRHQADVQRDLFVRHPLLECVISKVFSDRAFPYCVRTFVYKIKVLHNERKGFQKTECPRVLYIKNKMYP